jgi:acetylornithine deacetylase/succinyl-diaminopimelate desuccinylase-like protein
MRWALILFLAGLAAEQSAAGTSLSEATPPSALVESVRAYRKAHEVEILKELAKLVAIPNLAGDAARIRENAAAIVTLLERRGVTTRLLEVEGAPPAVYGELRTPGASRTIVLYAHYDGQPVDPARWTGDPWAPVLRDGRLEDGARDVPPAAWKPPLGPEWRLYGRSASDDKAPIVGLMAALDALRAAGTGPSVNLKFLFEGEEEAGSPHMAALLAAHGGLLKADAWLLCDGPVHQTRRMQLYFGARGITDLEVTVYGPSRPLHSGHYGNWAPNPAAVLAHLIAGLRDADGRILIPGFYDDVRETTDSERRALAEAPDVDRALKEAFGLGATEGGGAPVAERILLPALNVRGLASGTVGASAANAIPSEATASIDFRLVPDQTPEKVRARVEAHLAAQGFFVVREAPDAATRRAHPRIVKLAWGPGYPPARTSMDLPVSRAVTRAVEEAVGGPVIRMPTLGGSVPMRLFQDKTGSPVIGLPIVNHDNNQHAANENLRLQNLWDGIEVYAVIMSRLGPLLDR